MTSTSATPAWTGQELDSIDHAEELEIASLRRGGELGSRRTIWVVRVGDGIYVRSVNGPGSDWYRGTRARQEGRVQAGGVGKDVRMVDVGDEVNDAVDAAYRAKYGHYAAYLQGHHQPRGGLHHDAARTALTQLLDNQREFHRDDQTGETEV